MGLYTELFQNQISFQNHLVFQRYSLDFRSPSSRNTVENPKINCSLKMELPWTLKPTLIMFSTTLSFFILCIYLFIENKQHNSHLKEITETSVQHYERKPGAILGCFPSNTSREQCERKTFGHKEDYDMTRHRQN